MLSELNTIFLVIGLTLFILIGWPILFFGAPFMPSFNKRDDIDFEKIIDILKEEEVERVVDLGSGDGRLLKKLADDNFNVYGIEINPLFYWFSKWKLKDIPNIFIEWGNFWNKDLSKFDAVFLFHFKTANKSLVKKLKKELKNESLIISTGFELDSFEFVDQVSQFYIYKK